MKWLAALGIVGVLIAIPVFSYISNYNLGNRYEQQIIAVYENNENILAQYGQKVQEAAQVTTMQAEDFQKVYTEVMAGRYGADGSKAMFQWIQEQNPQIGTEVYTQIQRIIEAGRNDFSLAQAQLTDVKKSYRTALGSFWSGIWLGIAGYPTIKVGFRNGPDDFPIISTGRASDAFEKGQEDEPLKLR